MSTGADLLDAELQVSQVDEATKAEQQQFTAAASTTGVIPLGLIRKSDVALRDVQRQSENYMLLLASVKRLGVLNSITVREQVDPITKQKYYGLIDGLQRFTAATDAGLKEIPCNIVKMDDAEVLEAQLIGNLQRIQTKPAEVSKHLVRILSRNPLMTKQQLCERVCQSATWVDQRLSLINLEDGIKELVNNGQINLVNAYALSQHDPEEQKLHVEAAMTEPSKTFVPRMKQRKKEIKEARKKGADATVAEFTPVQHMQKTQDVKAELANGCPIGETLLNRAGLTTPEAKKAWDLAIAWVLHFDEESQAEQRREYDRKKAERDAEKERVKQERERQKQEKAAQASESLERGW